MTNITMAFAVLSWVRLDFLYLYYYNILDIGFQQRRVFSSAEII